MKTIKKSISLSVLLIALIVSGCVSWQKNYGRLKTIPNGQKHLTIQNLIDNWDKYHIYSSDPYAGPGFRSPLGIMFDPKNNDTMLVGDRWKKVNDQKTLTDMTKRISLVTQHEPWLNEILGADGLLYGYLYYSYGVVTLKVVGEKKMYIFNLEEPPYGGSNDD
ncbi:MAG TPA: hypothetical protein ENG14_00050 [Thermodesulforhabdus norvegica]|uniref:Uncharacterized protein n=1 Tax=Thermodesulforhabdus norvegica TaxID=39841 RepID=A0A7C1AV16_9BACT|nr:hypothetical protein [Thermodesulforhabdus norvegica]